MSQDGHYMVWRDGSSVSQVRHLTINDAVLEAKRLSACNPNGKFYIVRLLAYAECNQKTEYNTRITVLEKKKEKVEKKEESWRFYLNQEGYTPLITRFSSREDAEEYIRDIFFTKGWDYKIWKSIPDHPDHYAHKVCNIGNDVILYLQNVSRGGW